MTVTVYLRLNLPIPQEPPSSPFFPPGLFPPVRSRWKDVHHIGQRPVMRKHEEDVLRRIERLQAVDALLRRVRVVSDGGAVLPDADPVERPGAIVGGIRVDFLEERSWTGRMARFVLGLMRPDLLRQRQIRRGTDLSGVMARVATHEDESIVVAAVTATAAAATRRSSQPTNMPNRMPRHIKEVERPIAEKVVRAKVADLEGEFVWRDFDELAACKVAF